MTIYTHKTLKLMGAKYHLPITPKDKTMLAERIDDAFESIKDVRASIDGAYGILDGADPDVVLPLMKALGEIKGVLYGDSVWGKLVTINRQILGLETK